MSIPDLQLTYSVVDKCWIAVEPTTGEYGTGSSEGDAIRACLDNLHHMAGWFRDNDRPLGRFMREREEAFEAMSEIPKTRR